MKNVDMQGPLNYTIYQLQYERTIKSVGSYIS